MRLRLGKVTVSYVLASRPVTALHSFPTRRSSDLVGEAGVMRRASLDGNGRWMGLAAGLLVMAPAGGLAGPIPRKPSRSEEHTSELQSRRDLVCRLLLEKKNKKIYATFDKNQWPLQ